jgi:hypothetical protein
VEASIYSVRVWHRRTPRSPWKLWGVFADGSAAACALADWRTRPAGETLTIVGNRDPNEDKQDGC